MQEIMNQSSLQRVSGGEPDYVAREFQQLAGPICLGITASASMMLAYTAVIGYEIVSLCKKAKRLREELKELGVYDHINNATRLYQQAANDLKTSRMALARMKRSHEKVEL